MQQNRKENACRAAKVDIGNSDCRCILGVKVTCGQVASYTEIWLQWTTRHRELVAVRSFHCRTCTVLIFPFSGLTQGEK